MISNYQLSKSPKISNTRTYLRLKLVLTLQTYEISYSKKSLPGFTDFACLKNFKYYLNGLRH